MNGNIGNDQKVFGDNCEELTDKLFGTKRLSVKYDTYTQLPLDHTPIPDGIYIEIGGKLVDLSGKTPLTKGKRYNSNGLWSFGNLEKDCLKDFDIHIFYCVSRDGKIVERIYIFTAEDLMDEEKFGISITKNPTNRVGDPVVSRHDKCRVTDKEYLKKANDIWNNIIYK